MVKGQNSKQIIIEKILEVFDGAFLNDKEIRIPMIEDGAEVQIKVALTCAKENIEHGDNCGNGDPVTPAASVAASSSVTPPTEQEIQSVRDIMEKLGL